MADPAIDVQALSKTYRDGWLGRHRVNALNGVTFQVERGQIFGLLGPNGAGKTTLIKILLGIVRKSGGEASMLGRPAGDRRGRAQVGFLPENHRIPHHHTANSALEYYGRLSGLSYREIRSRRPELLETVGLDGWATASVRKFSKGMLQRLGLAQAMLHNPELLILDEPTDGVDPVGRSDMRALLQRLKQHGKMIFINSHLLQEVELVCDKVVILQKGTVQREATIEELTSRTGHETTFTVAGDEAAIRGALENDTISDWVALQSGAYQMTLRLTQQSDVNRVIDRLRQVEANIESLIPRRKTLEEAFLDIVSQPEAPLQAEVVSTDKTGTDNSGIES